MGIRNDTADSRESTPSAAAPVAPDELPFVAPCRALKPSAPLQWLQRGWAAVCAAPGPSLTYGAIIAALSALVSLIAWHFGSGWMLLVLLSAFVFVAPVLALAFYVISSQLERGERPSLARSLGEERRHFGDLLVFSLILLVVCLVWVRAGSGVQVFYPESGMPTLAELLGFFAIGSAVGSIFAMITFAASAFSLPMLIDRRADSVTAVVTSINAVLRNKRTMLGWAMLIVLCVAVGFATALVGLIVVMPLIGHATWHAYRDAIDTSAWPAYE
jgi:uncharacterized membrane protein